MIYLISRWMLLLNIVTTRVVKLSENSVFHDKSNHIEIKYHYIRDMVQRGAVKLQYVATEEQIADVLTKPLARVKFEYFREKLVVLQYEVNQKINLKMNVSAGLF